MIRSLLSALKTVNIIRFSIEYPPASFVRTFLSNKSGLNTTKNATFVFATCVSYLVCIRINLIFLICHLHIPTELVVPISLVNRKTHNIPRLGHLSLWAYTHEINSSNFFFFFMLARIDQSVNTNNNLQFVNELEFFFFTFFQ